MKGNDNFIKELSNEIAVRCIKNLIELKAELPERNLNLLNDIVVNKMTTEQTAIKYEISKVRVRQILNNMKRRIIGDVHRLFYSYKIIDSKNEELTRENMALKRAIIKNGITEPKIHVSENSLFNKKLYEFDFSVIASNCLKAAGIVTVYDLISHSKMDLLKYRNFGKKSLTELEDFVRDNHLTFSYKFNTESNKSSSNHV